MEQLLGPGLGHPPVPWPQAPPSQFRHFSPLISGRPSTALNLQMEKLRPENRSHVWEVDRGPLAPGLASSWLCLRGQNLWSFPLIPLSFLGPGGQLSWGWHRPAGFCQGWEQLIQLWGPPKPGAELWRLKATVIGILSRIPNLSRAGRGADP